jgi:hypothetical protein
MALLSLKKAEIFAYLRDSIGREEEKASLPTPPAFSGMFNIFSKLNRILREVSQNKYKNVKDFRHSDEECRFKAVFPAFFNTIEQIKTYQKPKGCYLAKTLGILNLNCTPWHLTTPRISLTNVAAVLSSLIAPPTSLLRPSPS